MTTYTQYNNPFDISLSPSQLNRYPGAYYHPLPGQPQFVAFPDFQTGIQAFEARIGRWFPNGYNSTIAEINAGSVPGMPGVYATDQNWRNNVADASGIGVNTPINPNDPNQMSRLEYGILSAEHGPGAANAVFGGPPGSASFTPLGGGGGGTSIGTPDIFGTAAASPSQLEDVYGLPPGTLTDNPQMLQDYQQDYAQDIGVNQTFQDTSGNFTNVPLPPSRPDFGTTLNQSGSDYPSGQPGGLSPEQMQQLPSDSSSMPGPVGQNGIGGGGAQGGGGIGGTLGGLGGITGGIGGGMPSFAAGGQNQQTMGIGGGQDMGAGGGGGIPVNITDAEKVAKKAGEDTKKGAEELGKNVSQTGQALDATMNEDTKQLTTEATKLGDFSSKLSTDPDTGLLPRIGVGAAAIVMVGLGLWMLGKTKEGHHTIAPA